jgi:serine/threonine-protein kinase
LAVGRWSRLYRARPSDAADCQSPGDFVLKTVSPEYAADPLPRALLAREAAVARQVQHANLTTVLADRSGGEFPHLVLPYVEGVSLAQVRRSIAGPLPVATACLVARQVAAALAALHDALWLHGDVTPANILVAPGGHTTLIDLGLTRRIGSEECRSDLLLAMTPGYAAPELLVPHVRLTPAADVYSLGLVLFEMLAGRPPFVAANSAEVHKLHVRQAPPDLRQLRPTASRELAELVRRLLVKEPLRRPASGDVVRWLAEIEIAEL